MHIPVVAPAVLLATNCIGLLPAGRKLHSLCGRKSLTTQTRAETHTIPSNYSSGGSINGHRWEAATDQARKCLPPGHCGQVIKAGQNHSSQSNKLLGVGKGAYGPLGIHIRF